MPEEDIFEAILAAYLEKDFSCVAALVKAFFTRFCIKFYLSLDKKSCLQDTLKMKYFQYF